MRSTFLSEYQAVPAHQALGIFLLLVSQTHTNAEKFAKMFHQQPITDGKFSPFFQPAVLITLFALVRTFSIVKVFHITRSFNKEKHFTFFLIANALL